MEQLGGIEKLLQMGRPLGQKLVTNRESWLATDVKIVAGTTGFACKPPKTALNGRICSQEGSSDGCGPQANGLFGRFPPVRPSCLEGHFPLQSDGHGRPRRSESNIACQMLKQIHGSVMTIAL